MSRLNYKGNKWFKCDLHLHTPASKCFQDRTVTAEQWVNRAIEQKLDCVAVTDHNSGEWIDAIKTAASGRNLIVFPGVEITCDTSKVHLLILFDPSKSTSDISDFLIRCNIDRANFADQEANTTLSILQVAEQANEHGALIIPAHIDEYNGLGSIGNDILDQFYSLDYINSVQVVHKEFLDSQLQTNNNSVLRDSLNQYYNNPTVAIDYTLMANWHRPVRKAKEHKLSIVTFSDNPHELKNPLHGLAGIGTRCTWIKMDDMPSIEGLRQAFLLPDYRVRNDFDSINSPYKTPELWIKSLTITDASITDPTTPLTIDFNPQLTTIIGGRGSGKSSILRFVRGIFNRTSDLNELSEILNDHADFYKRNDIGTQKGVLKSTTSIDVEFVRNGILHKISANNISNSINQNVSIKKYNSELGTWIDENAEGYMDFFQFEQYSQKQIYEIAQEPNSLRERIDNSMPDMQELMSQREVIKRSCLEKSAAIRTIQQQITGKGRLQTEIGDLNERIKLFQQSGIAPLLTSREKFSSQDTVIKEHIELIAERETQLDEIINSVDIPDIDLTSFEEPSKSELQAIANSVKDGISQIKTNLLAQKEQLLRLKTGFETAISQSNWQTIFNQNQNDFDAKKTELAEQGIDDISNFEALSESKQSKERELAEVIEIELGLQVQVQEKERMKSDYLLKCKEITQKRKLFVESFLQDDKIKVNINPFRNKTDFINKLRSIVQRETGFQNDIDNLVNLCFNGNVEQKIIEVREVFLKIRREEEVTGIAISGYFINLVKGMSDAQIDELELLYPEDEIDIKYKPSGSTIFKPLSTASAGQKTTAILTIILSQGKIPLLLDQPEDDLDNRLVYELIVDRLRQAKEHRQIIVVTHNANIPVNGDAEYIVSMDSESKKLKIFCAGTVEQAEVKKEICDVMEGSELAFDMRARRYKQLN